VAEMFIQPGTHWNIKKNCCSDGGRFGREDGGGDLEIFLFMQIANFLLQIAAFWQFLDINILKAKFHGSAHVRAMT